MQYSKKTCIFATNLLTVKTLTMKKLSIILLSSLLMIMYTSCSKDTTKGRQGADAAEGQGKQSLQVSRGQMELPNGDVINLEIFIDESDSIVSVLYNGNTEINDHCPVAHGPYNSARAAAGAALVLTEKYPCVQVVRTERSMPEPIVDNGTDDPTIDYTVLVDSCDGNSDCWYDKEYN